MTACTKAPRPAVQPKVRIDPATDLNAADLNDLCTATEDAIAQGGGFGWVDVPPRSTLESYWRGLMLVPGRYLYIARLDGLIAGALQLHEAPKNMQSQACIGLIQSGFTASWARGYGIGRELMETAITAARALGLEAVKLDVRETQTTAIRLYRSLGFVEWGHMPRYARIDGHWVAGLYFYLDL